MRIDAPLYYNSNAQEASSGGSSALEGDPAIEAGWSGAMTSLPLKFSVKLSADTDRYANVSQADEDEMSATFKTQYFDAEDDQALAPFVSYKGTLIFDATSSPWTQTRNNFGVGVAKVFNFDGGFRVLPISARSAANATWSVSVSVSVQRRIETPGADSTALLGELAVICTPSDQWAISLGVDAGRRWFDAVAGTGGSTARRDFSIEPLLTIVWDPSAVQWARRQLRCRSISSAKPAMGKSYTQWAVGPVLTVGWRF